MCLCSVHVLVCVCNLYIHVNLNSLFCFPQPSLKKSASGVSSSDKVLYMYAEHFLQRI